MMSQVNIPRRIDLFYGEYNPTYYFEWEWDTTLFLDYYGYSDDECMYTVTSVFRDVAYDWWVNVVHHRRTQGRRPIKNWSELRFTMRRAFGPTEHARRLKMLDYCHQRLSISTCILFRT